jgi:hypothetical protein
VIDESYNAELVFGSSASLLGETITGTFRYDTDLMPGMHPASTTTVGSWLGAYLPAPFLAITHTVNGVSRTFGGTYYNELDLGHGFPTAGGLAFRYQMFAFTAQDLLPLVNPLLYTGANLEVGAYDDSVQIVGDPHAPAAVDFSLTSPPYGRGAGHWDDLDANREITEQRVWGFRLTSISAGTVPQPGTLFLLGSGLAALWGKKRRRTGAFR